MLKAMCGNCIHFVGDSRKRKEKIGLCEITGHHRSKTSCACYDNFCTERELKKRLDFYNRCPITGKGKCCDMRYVCKISRKKDVPDIKDGKSWEDRVMRTFLGGRYGN
jgi:hypothetical protein